jgi:membrane carboxypeptidase/penicillin-binding protein PbpC
MLTAQAGNDVNQIFWYVNKRFLGSCAANEKMFYKPQHGTTKLTCADDKGRKADATIVVKWLGEED